ncbi:MAG: type IV secretory system conjugative DNA transfer family protein [Eubacterium sp.]|nr:type IV secretory system conjugative DNA transfer family protein [Eubacterium sp.]
MSTKAKKKTGIGTMLIYLCLAVSVLYCAAAVGLAFDKSKDENGKINFKGELMTNVESSFLDYEGILESIKDSESYCRKVTFLCGMFVGIYALVKYTSRKRLHRKGEEHGSARWATEAEAKKLADKKKVKKGEIDNNILLTQEVKMSLNTRQHRENLNVLVIGGSGSGKSRFYVKPNIMQLNTSYVVTDPKGELLRSTGKLLEDNGYKIKVFNLIDMQNSHNYNPFAYVYDRKTGELNKSYVIKMVNVLMKNTKQEGASGGDQFWDDATKALLSALAFYLLEKGAENEKNFAWVMQLLKQAEVKEDEEDYESPLDLKFKELETEDPTSMAVSYYKDFKKAAGETAKSILISCAVRLQAFNLPDVANLTHTDTLELDKIGDDKTALFVIIPSSDVTFNFLAAMMYTQLFDTLYDTANFKYNGRLPVHVRCLLDEFANIGTIPEFDKLLATMRSMEISANIIIQNIAQLKKMYEKSWEIITGNCDSLLFLGGQEASTTEMISKRLGKETIDVVAQNRTKGHRNNSTSINNSIMGRELLTADELTVLPTDECILMVRAFHPFYCHKYDIEKHPNYQYLEDSDKNNAYLIDEVKTLEMPPIAYNADDHIEKAEEDMSETDKKIMEMLEQAQMKEVSEILSETDIPDDDFDLAIEFGAAEDEDFQTSSENAYNDENPADIMFSDDVSEMEDKPYNGEPFERVDMSRPLSLEADDQVLMDDDELFI